MWHLHPGREQGKDFVEKLPPMPPGEYQLFGDITDKTGFPWTLVAKIKLPNISGTRGIADDSEWAGSPLAGQTADTTVATIPSGRIVWERSGPLMANAPASLKFRVENRDGSPARDLEPYMGMVAHAEVICSDLSVFAHVHPSGSVSMAALDLAQAGMMTDPNSAQMAMDMGMDAGVGAAPLPPEFGIPYGFPHSGKYRVFIQIKRAAQVQTAAFDVRVQ